MMSVPSTRSELRAVGNLGLALVCGLAGISLLLGDLSGTTVTIAGLVLLALGGLALCLSIRGLRG